MPAVTVVLPVFNGGSHLAPAVDSVLPECGADVELVVVDDGSTDGAVEALPPHPAMRVLRQPNTGLPGALRAGIAASTAPLIARMDADDVNVPGRIAAARAVLEQQDAVALVGCWAEVLDDEDQPVGAVEWPWMPDDAGRDLRYVVNNVVHGSVVFRRSAYEEAGGYRNVEAEDHDLWLRIVEHHDVALVPARLYHYRRGTTGITGTSGPTVDAAGAALLRRSWERGGPAVPGPRTARRRNRYYARAGGTSSAEAYQRSLLELARAARRHGHPALAIEALLAAASASPADFRRAVVRRVSRAAGRPSAQGGSIRD